MNCKDNLPQEDFEKTVIINADDNITIKLPQEAGSPGSKSAAGSRSAAPGKLRNADREIKLSIAGEVPIPEIFPEAESAAELCPVDSIYTLGEELGSGGQGVVRSGHDGALLRDVAVKTLRKELNSSKESRREFINEARLTAVLDHPAVIPIYNLCSDADGNLHLAMKKLRGISLKEYLASTRERYDNARIGNFDEDAAMARRISLFIKVCEAMSYVHSRKIIHCDLKPENIMLGQYGEVYIVDWGIARRFGENSGSSAKIMGTPRYTSPENLLGIPCDNRSDIYSLGVILFEIVTLNPAFTASSASEIIGKVKQGMLEPVRHRYGLPISRDLAAVIAKATALDPEKRYQSADALTADLQAFRRGAEVSANPDNFWKKIIRWANRNRRKAAAVAAGLLALLIAGGIVLMFASGMRNAEAERLRDNVIDNSLASAVQTAVGIDRTLTHISAMLGVLNADLAMLLDLDRPAETPGNPEIVPGDRTSQQCRGAVCFIPDADNGTHFTPGKLLDLSRASYIHSGSNAPERVEHILGCLRPAVSRMRRTVLRSRPGTGNVPFVKLQDAYRKLQLPVSFCYFTLDNGLHVVYPGNDDIRNGYDGRKRPWYTLAVGKGAIPVWSVPYRTVLEENSNVVSCSMEIIGAGDKFYGVSGVDVPLKVIEKMVVNSPDNAAYTLERLLITQDGRMVLRCIGDVNGFKVREPDESSGVFSSRILADMRTHRYGRLVRDENGKEILWIFSLIPSAKWIYVEKIDLSRLILFNRTALQ